MNKPYFDLTATRVYTARTLRMFVQGPIAIVACIAIIFLFALQDVPTHNFVSLTLLIALLFFGMIILRTFIQDQLENDDQSLVDEANLACHLSFSIMTHLKKNPENAYDILLASLKSQRGKFMRHEMGIKEKRFTKTAQPAAVKQDAVRFLQEALKVAEKFKKHKIDDGVIFYTFFQQEGVFENLLNDLDLSLEELANIVQWEEYHNQVWQKERSWEPAALIRTFGGVGRAWVTGFNDALDKLTTDLSQTVLYRARRNVIIHQDRLKDAMHVLSRSAHHNLIVVGEKGIGKRTFIENIAYQMRKNELQKGLAYTRMLVLKAQELLSGTENPDAFLLQALKRANQQGQYILVIENIGLFLRGGNQNVRGVLAKFLGAKNINIIGIADTKDYHALIKTDAVLDSQFEKIQLNNPSINDTMGVLMEEYYKIEEHKHVHVSYKALKSIIELAERYIPKGGFPGKAVELMNDAVLAAKKAGERYVLENHIREMVSLKAHMDVTTMESQEKKVLQSLAERMGTKIIGQKYAIQTIVNALKRARTDISDRKKPIGTFLFLGPTGVGKTQTAKVLAEEYFGDEQNMIRLDMNEYGTEDSVKAIYGSADPRYPAEGNLTKQVQDKPFSLILLDEIEKAHPKVVNLFLQILDEGQLIDGQGTKTDFKNTIIIATSNAGALFIQKFIREHPDPVKEEFKKALLDEILQERIFTPEFLNRFDDVVLYFSLTRDEAIQVAEMMITSIINDLERKRGVHIQIDEDAVAFIAERGYSPEFGAREMRRSVTDTLENFIADYMLHNDVKRGDTIVIAQEDLQK